VGEIADLFGYSSRSSAVHVINKLIKRNFVRKGQRGHLMTGSFFQPRIRILGSIAAGFPTPEEEELDNTLSLDEFLVNKPESTFMLEVKGDSMINAGIMPKDRVLVERGRLPKQGDVVVANVDGEWTMKYYRKDGDTVYLEAANPNYPNIYPQEQLSIGGVVVSVCRKLAA
jgi:repressor LexA